MLAAVRLGLFSYWVNSYCGGALAAFGGALVLGAMARVVRRTRFRYGVLLGIGMAILAITRPYEGLILCLVALARIAWQVVKSKERGILLRQAVTPVLLCTAAVAASLAYYDARVFLNPWTLPYTQNRAEYAVAQVFIWQSPRPEPVYRHAVMRDFYVNHEMKVASFPRTVPGFAKLLGLKVLITGFFVFGAVLSFPLAFLPRAIRDRRVRFLVWVACAVCAGLVVNAWLFPHYLAPVIGVFYVLLLQCMRHMNASRGAGPAMVRSLACACLLLVGFRLAAPAAKIEVPRIPFTWYGSEPLGLERARLQSTLQALPGRHLVFVRYTSGHNSLDDWVYNAADIDAAKIVWAREMDDAGNRELIRYFRDRKVWVVEPDRNPPALYPVPYPVERPSPALPR